jgi:hypothetical protein
VGCQLFRHFCMWPLVEQEQEHEQAGHAGNVTYLALHFIIGAFSSSSQQLYLSCSLGITFSSLHPMQSLPFLLTAKCVSLRTASVSRNGKLCIGWSEENVIPASIIILHGTAPMKYGHLRKKTHGVWPLGKTN